MNMNEKELMEFYEERLESERRDAHENMMREVGYVILRFCNGRIQYDVSDISSVFFDIEVERIYRDGKIIWNARLKT